MAATAKQSTAAVHTSYDRMKELKEFDETKAGVKGLVDSGTKQIPRIFIHSPENLPKPSDGITTNLQIPVIDLQGISNSKRRQEIVKEVREASKSWGFFQLLNHGVRVELLDSMTESVKRFHEQDKEEKAKFHSRDPNKKVKYYGNFDLYSASPANWRDTLSCFFDGSLDPAELPSICRDVFLEYRQKVTDTADTVCEILSEALGLNPDYFKSVKCTKAQLLVAHYYPSCPQPELTIGIAKHSDPSFLTLLLQDNIGGLQVLHEDRWVAVSPIHGALVVNIGDLLQLISNGKFKSAEHRVLANRGGPRISIAVFFNPGIDEKRPMGPIKETLSDENPAKYQEILFSEYFKYYTTKGLDGESALKHFQL
ncbi:uncharacterized protein A4U43_C04F18050 [Asparagus officinalis]|uniref:Fe2OG dioxygenase domain-containing protein n=1 Tax=Asparagus officinalis TaxID=4686 RepID=A0A5P1F1U2_ASPOF|nr:1-aminocyclopropane-1-carboxylate oxidase homolog 1-like [Asparagus officinalis]ONK72315.1 uncharacterized protein A4U43_C04F18050 [Asparagus officinalis]